MSLLGYINSIFISKSNQNKNSVRIPNSNTRTTPLLPTPSDLETGEILPFNPDYLIHNSDENKQYKNLFIDFKNESLKNAKRNSYAFCFIGVLIIMVFIVFYKLDENLISYSNSQLIINTEQFNYNSLSKINWFFIASIMIFSAYGIILNNNIAYKIQEF